MHAAEDGMRISADAVVMFVNNGSRGKHAPKYKLETSLVDRSTGRSTQGEKRSVAGVMSTIGIGGGGNRLGWVLAWREVDDSL